MQDTPPPRSLGIGLIGLGHHGLRYARHLLDHATAPPLEAHSPPSPPEAHSPPPPPGAHSPSPPPGGHSPSPPPGAHSLPRAHLAAVCRRKTGVDPRLTLPDNVPVYTDYHALLADPRVDAVVLVVPPALNLPIGLAAVHARKPLLVEKPLTVTAPEAHLLVEAAARAGVPLMTAQTLRFDATILALRSALSHVGPPRYLSLTSRIETKPHPPDHAAGYGNRGALLEIGVHLLDLVRHLTGEEIAAVRCETDTLPPTPETLATATLHTTSGLPCFLEIARVAAGRVGRIDWIAAHGQLSADWHRSTLTGTTPAGPLSLPPITPHPTVAAALTAFIQALHTRTPPPITGEDGLRAVELVDACLLSACSAGARVLLPLATPPT